MVDHLEQLATDSRAIAERAFMARVYNWMAGGLALTGLTAYLSSTVPALAQIAFNPTAVLVLFLVELALVWALRGAVMKLSASAAMAIYTVYSAINGITLAFIFLLYTKESIAATFFVTAGTFAGMSIYATVTKSDLTSWGSYLRMAVWGLIIASLVNIFFASSTLYWATTYLGVAVFVGLTAYDTQQIRQYATDPETDEGHKLAIYGALSLYLDFINLFLYLLRLFGKRR